MCLIKVSVKRELTVQVFSLKTKNKSEKLCGVFRGLCYLIAKAYDGDWYKAIFLEYI